MRGQVFAAVVLSVVWTGTVFGQPPGQGGLSTAERALLWQATSRGYSGQNFQRQIFAAESLGRNERTRQQQQLRQQYGAAQLAQQNQARLRGTLSPGMRAGTARGRNPSPSTINRGLDSSQPDDSLDWELETDMLLVWDVLGIGFLDATKADLFADGIQHPHGMTVIAVRVDSPADKAGLQRGDVIVGLHKYKLKSYSDAAYVADLPDLAKLGKITGVVLRDGKSQKLSIDVSTIPTRAPAKAPVQEKPAAKPAAGKGAVPPRLDDEPPTKSAPPTKPAVRGPPPEVTKPVESKPAEKPVDAPKFKSATPPRIDDSLDNPPQATKPVVEKVIPAPPPTKPAEEKVIPTPPREEPKDSPPVAPVTAAAKELTIGELPQGLSEDEAAVYRALGIRADSTSGPLPDKRFRTGLKITALAIDSPARKAGWQVGDILVGVLDYQMTTIEDLAFVATDPKRELGATLEFRLLRGPDVKSGKVTLAPVANRPAP